ncbi:hypothetical protein [Paenibacillus cremeus]|uniref:Lipoprotein n=1 Tax=Paenibacillus cremeus TaxID=2163881 RepID=A0A559K4I4_9BACL|nr:hypothetical protein [Paenibacillus cremeus]TVY07051.1 hypothetical protein FPZ49_26220 [Paenibacillus cremeus]
MKILFLSLFILLILGFSGCSPRGPSSDENERNKDVEQAHKFDEEMKKSSESQNEKSDSNQSDGSSCSNGIFGKEGLGGGSC